MGGWMDIICPKYVTVEKSIKTGSGEKSAFDAHNSQIHSIPQRKQLHLFSANVRRGLRRLKKAAEPVKAQLWSQIRSIELSVLHFRGYTNWQISSQSSPPVPAKCSLVLWASFVRQLLRFFLSRGWHNQRVSVVWSGGSTHTQSAVTRSRVRCFSMEISCVSSLDYCSGCQNPHRYTSYTPSHVHTHSIASPNQALCVLSLLLMLSLWSFTGVWFFIPFHSSTSLFLNPPPHPFSNPPLF